MLRSRGKPVPTVRLENYRDGLEDFAYACILEGIIDRLEAKGAGLTGAQRRWLAQAHKTLPVPDGLVKTMGEYSRDPAALYAYRSRVARLIDSSDMADTDPWGPDFGVRGFSSR